MKLYLDADVWLNFWLDEMLGFLPASHYLEELLKRVRTERWVIIFSGIVKSEILKKKIALKDLEEKILELEQEGILEYVEAEKKDYERAEKIYRDKGLHFPDSLHAAIAIKHKAIMVTRTKHFDAVKDVLELRKPEDLL